MLQLGNLAVIAAERPNVLLQVLNGEATIFVGDGPERKQFTVDWRDNEKIEELIYELNYGALRAEKIDHSA